MGIPVCYGRASARIRRLAGRVDARRALGRDISSDLESRLTMGFGSKVMALADPLDLVLDALSSPVTVRSSPPMVANPSRPVLVTGGSGYIAGFCIAELLRGGWRVRATVRNLAKADQVRASIAKLGADPSGIEWTAADLLSDDGWEKAAEGAEYVLHVASPLPSVDLKTDDDYLRPARDGALRVLKAARNAGVRRVVMTSSSAAIGYGRQARDAPFTEVDWSDETNRTDTTAYERAKTIAERTAWAWLAADGGGLELATVNPTYVLGPIFGADFSVSLEVVKKLLDGSSPLVPRFNFDVVDVRDIARLHLLAMTTPGAAGERFIGAGEALWMKDIALMLKQGLGDQGKKVPTLPAPDFVVRLLSLIDPVVRSRLFELGKVRPISSEKARRMLGWTTRPAAETLLDAARSLQANGIV
jgi:dihydroflavonol-4-reductase